MVRPAVVGEGVIASLLKKRLSPLARRDLLAFLAVLLTTVASSGGLHRFTPWLWVGLIAGGLAAIISGTAIRAAATGAAGAFVGLLIGPADVWTAAPGGGPNVASVALAAVLAGAVGLVLALAPVRRLIGGRLVLWLVVSLLLFSLSVTTLTLNGEPTLSGVTGAIIPPFNEQLGGVVPEGAESSDNVLFFRVYRSVAAGEDYYPAYRKWFEEWGHVTPKTLLNYRMPFLFHAWAAMPQPQMIVWMYLVMVAGVSAGLVALLAGTVKQPLVVPAVAALCSFALYSTTSLLLFSMEPWAVLPGILTLAFTAASQRSERWKAYTVASVVCALVAVMFRETMAPIMLAGLASAGLAAVGQRRFRLMAWGAGWATLAGTVLVHYWLAAPYLDPESRLVQFVGGGLLFAFAGLEYATDYLGAGGAWPYLLAALGFAGALVTPGRSLKTFALLATVGPFLAFVAFANSGREHFLGEALNYWGAVLTPMLYACIPFVFLLLPSSGGRSSGSSDRNRA